MLLCDVKKLVTVFGHQRFVSRNHMLPILQGTLYKLTRHGSAAYQLDEDVHLGIIGDGKNVAADFAGAGVAGGVVPAGADMRYNDVMLAAGINEFGITKFCTI